MYAKLVILPLFLTGALLVGCDDRGAPSSNAESKAAAKQDEATAKADAKAAADSAEVAADRKAADAKAAADKAAADAKAASAEAAAKAEIAADKKVADARAAADKVAADAKADADKATAAAVRDQAGGMLKDLQTAVTDQKWTEAGVLVKQIDGLRDSLAADQKASFDSLKKQYETLKR
jgi:hypothetical protein